MYLLQISLPPLQVMATNIIQSSDGHYLVSKVPFAFFTYDINQTHMLSWGFRGHPQFAAESALALSTALVDSGLLLESKLKLCREEDECTTRAVKLAFKMKARFVGENGLLIFSYHGPAATCGPVHSLVSSNYTPESPATHITSATILEWLEEVEVKPKQILCFLDCPFASQIASTLLTTEVEKLCVLCANTPVNSSLLTTTLRHTMFTYFAVWAFKKCTKSPEPDQQVQRLIYVKDIGNKIEECCAALNSLCISENSASSSSPSVMSFHVQVMPLLQRFDDNRIGEDMIDGEVDEDDDMVDGEVDEGDDMIDGEVAIARFSFLHQHYRAVKKKHRLCDKGHEWLKHLKDDNSPLHVLRRNDILHSEVTDTVLRLVLYSLAIIQDSSIKRSVGKANTFITLYLQAAGIVEHVASMELTANGKQFELMFEAYCLALEQRKVSDSEVSDLARKVRLAISD